jgi:hypothetical protein
LIISGVLQKVVAFLESSQDPGFFNHLGLDSDLEINKKLRDN